ncbi:MAG: hypothetical protein JRJ86_07700 [Deltaproteobacteria bacterium]|nr:hypothetical protein [Deltaproteobacteria bacterium]
MRSLIGRKIRKYVASQGSEDPLAGLSNRLKGLAESLDTTCKSVEPQFMQLIEALQSVYSDACQLSQQAHETVNPIGGDSGEGVLTNVESLAKASLAQLNHCKDEVTANLGRLEAIDQHLGGLSGLCAMIKKIGRFLRVVGLNMGIESARSMESGEMFTAVFEDTRKLAGNIIDLAETIGEEIKTARYIQMAAHLEVSDEMNHLIAISNDADKAAQRAVLQIGQLIGRTLDVMQKTGVHAREISRLIGEMVVGLQLYDAMAQRIEHIVDALADAEGLCAQAVSAGEPGMSLPEGTGDRNLDSSHRVVSLQAAQLEHVIAEVEALHQKSVQTFGAIGREAGGLGDCFALIVGPRYSDAVSAGPGGAREDPFKDLQAALNRLHRFLEQTHKLLGRVGSAQERASEAAEAAVRIADHTANLEGINFKITLLALNAIVKATHMGERGRVFEVLSQEVKGLSNQCATCVTRVQKMLVAVDVETGEMKTVRETDSSVSLEAGIREVARAYEQFRHGSADVSQKAAALNEKVSNVRAGLDFIPALAEALRRDLDRLEQIGRTMQPWLGDRDGISGEVGGQLAERYTMQKERHIHEAVMARSDDAGDPFRQDLEQSGGENEDKEVFFHTDPETPPPAMEREPDAENNEADVVFFSDTGEENLSVTKEENPVDLEDDSVEFF